MRPIPKYLASHYYRLGLNPSATRDQIGNAYRAAALKHHPDRGGNGPTFARLTESYNVLLRHTTPSHEYYTHPNAFRPAFLRSYFDSQNTQPSTWMPVLTAIVLPTIIGVIVGIRLIYGGEREGLRAGGTSRFVPGGVPSPRDTSKASHSVPATITDSSLPQPPSSSSSSP